jgi:hypothetical protein
MSAAIHRFINRELYRLNGFLHPIDTMVFTAILDYQNRKGWLGGIAEIGVFYGRSLALMVKYLKPGEKAYGADLFDIDEHPGADSDQLLYVKKHLGVDKSNDAVILKKGNSANLKPADITQAIGKVRFFSIDGGHELPDILHDGMLAMESLTDEGVIAYDDFFNPQYPDLTVGVLDLLRKHTDFVSFCSTNNKLYVCKAAYYDEYFAAMQAAELWGNSYQVKFTFLGRQIVHWTQSLKNRIIYQKCMEIGMGSLGERLISRSVLKVAR